MENINISNSEWKIMQVLWKNPNLTLKEIVEKLDKKKWKYSTIRTLVNRLHDKKVIAADMSGGNYKYYAIISEENCKINETINFLEKVYDGSIKMLVSAFTKESNLTKKEIKELMDIIDKMEGDR